ncbi:MAG: PorP/SprF family type IX secretion system membrane protein, partial [Bacteroidia bacterium]
QDTHFSQFYMSPLTQNPAMAGAVYDMQALINYRNQWSSIATPFKTMAASYDMRLVKKKNTSGYWAAGINLYNDNAGDLQMTTTQVNLNVAYHVKLNDYNTLGGGLMAGFAQRSISPGGIKTGNQYNGMAYDASLPTGENITAASFSYMDLGGGIVYTYNNTAGAIKVTDNHDLKFQLGVAVFHPQQPGYSFYNDGEKLYMKFVVHGNALLSIPNTNVAFVPGFMYNRQGPAQEIYAGSLIRYKLKQDSKYTGFQKGAAISLGAYYRAGDGVAAAMLMEYANYAFGFSYDINTSGLQTATNARGGMEITLRFVNPNPFLYQHGTQSRF